MATFEATRSPKCCPWTNQGYLTFPHTPRRPRPDPREAYTRAYPNRVGPADLTLEGPVCMVSQLRPIGNGAPSKWVPQFNVRNMFCLARCERPSCVAIVDERMINCIRAVRQAGADNGLY